MVILVKNINIQEISEFIKWHMQSFSNFIEKLCSEELQSAQSLKIFTSKRLIPLDKNAGLRPIGTIKVIGKSLIKQFWYCAKKKRHKSWRIFATQCRLKWWCQRYYSCNKRYICWYWYWYCSFDWCWECIQLHKLQGNAALPLR